MKSNKRVRHETREFPDRKDVKAFYLKTGSTGLEDSHSHMGSTPPGADNSKGEKEGEYHEENYQKGFFKDGVCCRINSGNGQVSGLPEG